MKITMTDYDGTKYAGSVPADIAKKINRIYPIARLASYTASGVVLVSIVGAGFAMALDDPMIAINSLIVGIGIGAVGLLLRIRQEQKAAALINEAKDRLGFPKPDREPVSTDVFIHP